MEARRPAEPRAPASRLLGVRTVAYTLGFFVLVMAFGAAGLELHVDASLRRLRAQVEDERAGPRPPPPAREALYGETRDGDAREGYEAAIAAILTDLPAKPLSQAIEGAALGAVLPLSATLTALLEAHRGEVETLRRAAHARGDAALDARGSGRRVEAMRTLTWLVVLEGHESACRGDARGAAERYLDAARFAADVAAGGSIVSHMIGLGLLRSPLHALDDLVANGHRGAGDLEMLATALERMPRLGVLLAGALDQERRVSLDYGYAVARGDPLQDELSTPLDVLPLRMQIALTWRGRDEIWREAIAAVALADREARRAAVARAETHARAWWSGLALFDLGAYYAKSDATEQRLDALRKAVRTARGVP